MSTGSAKGSSRTSTVSYSGYNNVFLGQPKDGLKTIERCIEVSPHDPSLPIICFFAGVSEFHCGNYANSSGWLDKSLSYDPGYGSAKIWLAGAKYLDGRKRDAETVLGNFRESSPGYSLSDFDMQWGHARSTNAQYLAAIKSMFGALDALKLPRA